MSTTNYRVLVYRFRAYGNLGDAIQTYALCRLLPQTAGVYRDSLNKLASGPTAVINGYLGTSPPAERPDCLFAGVYVPWGWHYFGLLSWLGATRFPNVGARDPVTLGRLNRRGVAADIVGCATLTLGRYRGPRRGVYAVDFPDQVPDKGFVSLTHRTPRGMTWPEQWRRAVEYLDAYRTAERVYTSRLHVAIPCIAFGTPVCLHKPRQWFGLNSTCGRFSLFDSLGLPYRELVELDAASLKERYLRFIRSSLGVEIEEHEPSPPIVANGI